MFIFFWEWKIREQRIFNCLSLRRAIFAKSNLMKIFDFTTPFYFILFSCKNSILRKFRFKTRRNVFSPYLLTFWFFGQKKLVCNLKNIQQHWLSKCFSLMTLRFWILVLSLKIFVHFCTEKMFMEWGKNSNAVVFDAQIKNGANQNTRL